VIYGVGTDLIEITRVERALARFGVRFAQRVLCEPELKRFATHAKPAAYLAKHLQALSRAGNNKSKAALLKEKAVICSREGHDGDAMKFFEEAVKLEEGKP